MPSVTLHPPPPASSWPRGPANPLPELLHTPSGLAIIELQGTLHFPTPNANTAGEDATPSAAKKPRLTADASGPSSASDSTEVGRLVFPLYDPANGQDGNDKAWMKRVYLYVGQSQRMTGEVKVLAKPLAVIRRKEDGASTGLDTTSLASAADSQSIRGGSMTADAEDLEIVEIIRHKIIFASRPEPVSSEQE